MNRPEYRNAQNSAMTYALDDAFYRGRRRRRRQGRSCLPAPASTSRAGHDIGTPGPRHRRLVRPRRAGLWWDHVGKPGAESRYRARAEVYLGMCRRWRELPEADDRDGPGRVHRRRADARLGLRPDRRRRRRVLRRPGGADGHPRRRVLRAPVGDGAALGQGVPVHSASASTPRAPSGSAWSTASCRAPSSNSARSSWPSQIATMPRLGLALTKKAVNQAEDLMGLRVGHGLGVRAAPPRARAQRRGGRRSPRGPRRAQHARRAARRALAAPGARSQRRALAAACVR